MGGGLSMGSRFDFSGSKIGVPLFPVLHGCLSYILYCALYITSEEGLPHFMTWHDMTVIYRPSLNHWLTHPLINWLNYSLTGAHSTIDARDEVKDERRRNSLAFYISSYMDFEGEDFQALVTAVEKDRYAKMGGKVPVFKDTSEIV